MTQLDKIKLLVPPGTNIEKVLFSINGITAQEISDIEQNRASEDSYKRIINLIKEHFMEKTIGRLPGPTNEDGTMKYSSIEDFEKKTGQRFRMKKAHKVMGLTRQQSFEVIWLGKSHDQTA